MRPQSALKTSCPACGSADLRELSVFNGEQTRIVHCKECKLELLQPRPSVDELRRYYDGYTTTQVTDAEFRFLFDHSLKYFKHRAVNGVTHSQNSRPRYLEVGFGHGASLIAAATLGMESFGVDLDGAAICSVLKRAKEYGVNVTCTHGDISGLNRELFFDIIKASQIIEHTIEPCDFLNELFLRQPSEGVLLMECPNNDAAFWRIKNVIRERYGRSNFYKSLKLNEHLSGFTKRSLSLMLRKVGYEVVRLEDYAIRDPRFHHENLLWYPKLREGLFRSYTTRNSYHFLKATIPIFDLCASRFANSGTHLALVARKSPALT